MDRAKRVAEEDFRAFHRRTFGHVWTVLARAGIQREAERKELAQDVYLVAHQKRATREVSVPELAWIGCVARRLAWRSRARAPARKEQPMEPDSVSEPIATGSSPEDAVLYRGQYHEVMESVREDHREVFEMHKIEGFTLEEIAATLEKPVGTVSTWLRRAHEEIDAAVARIRAREARAGYMMFLPLAAGDWRQMAQLFDAPRPGTEEEVWEGVCRGLARAALIGGGTTAAGVAARKVLAFASGVAVGGGAVGAAFALHLLGAEPARPPPIARAPETASATLAPIASATEGAATGGTGQAAASAPSSQHAAPVAMLDPEEERILARAESAYSRGRIDEAKAALAEHARRFPNGALKAERERLRAKIDGQRPANVPDAGRAPHRMMDTDDD